MPLWFSRHRAGHRTPFVELDTRVCQACWRCCEACPTQVMQKVSVLWHKHAVFRTGEDCVGCGACVAVCEAGALRLRTVRTVRKVEEA